MSKPPAPQPEDPSIEKALERIETLVREVESGKLTLEETIARFEEGSALAKSCRQKLDAAERKIQIILRENGEPAGVAPLD